MLFQSLLSSLLVRQTKHCSDSCLLESMEATMKKSKTNLSWIWLLSLMAALPFSFGCLSSIKYQRVESNEVTDGSVNEQIGGGKFSAIESVTFFFL